MFTGELYPYQVDAALDIQENERWLLAYEMGLGKTPITIAALEGLHDAECINSTLIVVPASLKWQWAKALLEFTDAKPSVSGGLCWADGIVIDGTKRERETLWRMAAHQLPPKYVICSYNALRLDWDLAQHFPHEAMVCDEATALKNFRGKTAKLVKSLQPRYRIALSGTPVENRPEELYSIMQWVDAELLGRWDLFDKSFIVRNSFGGVQRYKNLDLLHARLSGSMSRKSRKDPEVAPYLPDVTEVDIPIELDAVSRRSYRHIEKDLEKALEALRDQGTGYDIAEYYAGGPTLSGTVRGVVMARMQALHMFLDHPTLLSDSARGYDRDNSGSQYCSALMRNREFVLSELTPKLDALESLVRRMIDEDGKIIIFTQYRRMMHVIENRLKGQYDLQYVVYHGAMSSSEKETAASRFQDDPNTRLFISTDAGGYGLDLPAANFLINYDLPYSGGKRQQRNARHVRASSKHEKVYIANLICEETVERRVRDVLDLRERVAGSIIDGIGETVIANDVDSLSVHIRH